MRVTQTLALTTFGFIGLASAFTSTTIRHAPTAFKPASLHMASESNVPIIISGNNIDVTPSMMDYVNKKLERVLGKLSRSGNVRECDVHLSVNKNPKVENAHKAEVVTSLKGTTIRCAEERGDMYTSIDCVSERLARKLRQYKERRLSAATEGKTHMGENIADFLNDIVDEDEETETSADVDADFVDFDAPIITKIKSFDLSKPISVKEAIFALDYIDHDFYVFKDKENNEISVVYKRNAGGVGLIQPQKDNE
eukprot:CAMPEP_0195519686 /NCGR_PEP_ID=MMETSP0794_2-20130614/15263_1 /TAXON_ID=515487 /ORGANISM="Stephanopyxis turris, Strain CCMP 815" /LENGTH=252 /DNA_ID=CAMNT_0040648879 /DNA_START=20 /DNA_END=778 /DNA_ORIENTATION=+